MGRQPRRRKGPPDSGVSGCLVIDKPAGMTSHDVVDRVRKALGTRKVGHAGTLDPDATGVLVLGVGKATKLLQFVTGANKRYTGELVLGTATSTLDAAGEVTGTWDMSVTAEQVEAAAQQFVGDIEQVPPMVSAIKIDGKRLHELAREGKEVDRPPRPVTVTHYRTEATADPLVYEIDALVSSGTYIRSLAADVGTALGGGAHLRALRRHTVGSFTLDEARSLDDLDAHALLPVADMLRGLPKLEVDEAVAQQVRFGRPLGPSGGSGQLAIADQSGNVLAVYEVQDGEMKPVKVLEAAG